MELLPILTGIASGWNDDRGSRLNSTLYHYFYLYSLVLVGSVKLAEVALDLS